MVASYEYDPYGGIAEKSGTLADINPMRYRGYYYDTETGFYYLQSRYYDPELGRFINADAFTSTGQGILGNNMFAYCGNNPIINIDPTGHAFGAIIGGIVGGILGGITAVASGKSVAAGIITGAVTGAIVGGICDGTTWAAAAVAGAMAKCAAVAACGNLANQYINYQLEKSSNQSSKPIETTNNSKKQSSAVSQGSKNVSGNVAQTQITQSFAEYVDYGDIIKSAVTTAIFAPLSVGGGHVVNSVFRGATQGTMTKATQFIAETAMGSNVSMLQTATEFIIQIFE